MYHEIFFLNIIHFCNYLYLFQSVIFQSQVFHPAIDPSTGTLFLGEVFPKWSKSVNHIWQILKYIHWTFQNINLKTPANSEALKM